jgi:hypothetical protein
VKVNRLLEVIHDRTVEDPPDASLRKSDGVSSARRCLPPVSIVPRTWTGRGDAAISTTRTAPIELHVDGIDGAPTP